jgi:hypothetical protein
LTVGVGVIGRHAQGFLGNPIAYWRLEKLKFGGLIRQVMVRGIKRVDQVFVLTMAAYNLTRMRTLKKIRLKSA